MTAPEKISFRLPQSVHLEAFDVLIKEEIGSGGFGSVYLAEHQGNQYAIKLYRMWEVLPSERANFLERIYQEFKISETLATPYAVKIFSYQELKGNPLLIMEFCEGGSLRDLIGHAQDDHKVLKIAEDICKGLMAMHEKGIVHRDIKPENILCKPQNYVLTDFGISVSLHKRLTQTDIRGHAKQVFASAAYAPPEQANGELAYKNTGPTNDIYAFGVVLYELLTLGHLPFGSFEQYEKDPLKYEQKKKHEDWDYTRLIDTQVKAFWKNIIVKCLKPHAHERFQDVAQILELLSSSDFSEKPNFSPELRFTESKVGQQHGWKLTLISDERLGQSFCVSTLSQNHQKPRLTIGRFSEDQAERNDICIEEKNEASVSRHHATLEKTLDGRGNEQWYIRDGQWYQDHGILDWYLSINGVYVNEHKIGKYGTLLHEGDIIALGNVALVFQKA